ncbi:MAG: UbiA family prenyltransferase [Betaproteobacteria bacterium]|nr:UbiA family prenyltransferase [Betaproteobacteria bacterium]
MGKAASATCGLDDPKGDADGGPETWRQTDGASAAHGVPLFVDLDGTLTRTDLLIETAVDLLRRRPWLLISMFVWLLRGRSVLKSRIAELVAFDPALLPANAALLEFLRAEAARGRALYLASAADERLVSAVAAHFGFFAGFLGSTPGNNLAGRRKAAALANHSQGHGYCYAGNARVDLPVWEQAREAIVVNARAAVVRAARKRANVVRVFDEPAGGLQLVLKAIRIHQWLKNVLLFVPLVTAQMWWDMGALAQVVAAFVAFSLCASGTYLLNDILDLPSDRGHPAKRKRPLASGAMPLSSGLAWCAGLLAAGVGAAALVSAGFLAVMGAYIALTVTYSVYLKRLVLLDVMTLAALYTLRIIAGAVAIGVVASFWLLSFSVFLFLSLALVKRCSELLHLAEIRRDAASGRDYRVTDLPILQAMGVASGYLSVLVLAFYINSQVVTQHYAQPQVLWLLCALVLVWMNRVWIKTARNQMDDDPVVFSLRDKPSWLLAAAAAAVILLAASPI